MLDRHRRRDLAFAAVLAIVAFVVYRASFQVRQFGDSSLLVSAFAAQPDGGAFWYHALYMPAAGLVGRLLWWVSAPEVLRVLSAGSGGLGVGFTYLLARGWSASRVASLLAAGLLAVSPGYWFFSTSIEVHALHAACVGLCALVALHAPWHRPVAASLLTAATLPLLFLSHQSGVLLGPGFVVLSQFARTARGLAPFRWRTLLFAIGPLYLLALIGALPISAWLGNRSLGTHLGESQVSVAHFAREFDWPSVWEGWIQPLGALTPLAAAGVSAARRRAWALAAPLAFVLPSAAFFLTWGLPERGGYTLGSSMFVALLCALALDALGPARVVWGGALLVAQALWGHSALRAWDAPEWHDSMEKRRDSIVQAIGERGGVISLNTSFQYIETELPDVVELNLLLELTRSLDEGRDPQAFLAAVRPRLEGLLRREDRPLLLDRSYAGVLERVAPQALPYSEALEAWLAERCELRLVPGSAWPLVQLRRRGTLSSR